MIHPQTSLQFINPLVGSGVVATETIPDGTIVWVQDSLDQVIRNPKHAKLPDPVKRALDIYAYRNARGHHVLCWDKAKYVNHSCEANCLSPGLNLEIALRDIQPGEQLTDDYASLNLDEGFECHCQTPGCRSHVRPEDASTMAPIWDRQILQAFVLIRTVDQPLWSLLSERDRATIERCMVHVKKIPSIRRLLLPRPDSPEPMPVPSFQET